MSNPATDTRQASHGRNIIHTVVGSGVAPIASLITAPLLAQGLGVVGRGELAAAVTPITLASTVGALGFPTALINLVARFPGATRRASWLSLWGLVLSGSLVSVLIWIAAPALSGGNQALTGLIRITAAASIPTLLVAIPASIVVGRHRWRLQAYGQATAAIVRLLAVLTLFLADRLTPLSATLVMVLAPLSAVLVYAREVISYLRSPDSNSVPHQATWTGLTSFGLRVWVGSLSGIILIRVSQLLMVPLSNEAQAGILAVAVSLGELPLIISGAVRDVTFSAESGAASDRRLQQSARISFTATAVFSLLLAITLPWLVPLLFGDGFSKAVQVSWLIFIATTLGSTGSVAGAGLGARGRPGLRSWAMFFGAVCNVTVLLLAVPRLGVVGGALATIAGSTVAGSMNVIWLRRHFGLSMRGFYGLRREDIAVFQALVRRALGPLGRIRSR